jgi:hypothetical protein
MLLALQAPNKLLVPEIAGFSLIIAFGYDSLSLLHYGLISLFTKTW